MWYLPEMSILYFDVRCIAESARSQTTYLGDDHACLVEWDETKSLQFQFQQAIWLV